MGGKCRTQIHSTTVTRHVSGVPYPFCKKPNPPFTNQVALKSRREQIKEVPSQLVNCFSQKDYLQATRLLTSALNTSENTLKEVVGLQELKSELAVKKQVLFRCKSDPRILPFPPFFYDRIANICTHRNCITNCWTR